MAADGGPFFFCEGDPPYAKHSFPSGLWRQAGLICTGVNSIFWFSWSFGSYQTIYLQEVGFTASQLGLLNALTSILSIASVSFWGMVSDRIGSLRKVLITVLVGGVGLFALIPLIPRGFPIPRHCSSAWCPWSISSGAPCPPTRRTCWCATPTSCA